MGRKPLLRSKFFLESHTHFTTEDIIQDLFHDGHGDPLQLNSVCRPIFLWRIVVQLGPNGDPLAQMNMTNMKSILQYHCHCESRHTHVALTL